MHLPHNPEPWPLARVPYITELDMSLVLYSMAQEVLSASDPFALSNTSLETFLNASWGELGLSEQTEVLFARFESMFGIPLDRQLQDALPQEAMARAFGQWLDSPRIVTFFTSGSTGKPKPCSHPEDHLRQELVGIAPLMAGCAAARVPVPLHHMYGFTFGLQLPRTLGIPIIKTAPLPQVITAQMRPGDLLVGIPHLWTRVVAGQPVNGKDITLLTATAPTPPHVLATLHEWGFRCREMFGASETGCMCWRETPEHPFTLLPHFVRETREGDRASAVRRALPDGTLHEYALLDSINWVDEEHLLPAGRKDTAVQVAGRNVFPSYVAEILRIHDAVADCTVRLMRPEEGDRLKAFVVPRSAADTGRLLIELKELCRQRLHSTERPATYTFGVDLPRTGLGKPTDW